MWAHLKREFYKRLHRRTEDIKDMDHFRQFLQAIIDETPLNMERLVLSNFAYVKRMAELDDQGSDSE